MKQLIYKIILIFLLFFIISYKKKSKGVFDPSWRKESQKIASDICKKLSSCSKDSLQKLKPSWKSYASSFLREDKCTKKNENSPIHNLSENSVEVIKEVSRSCYKVIMQMNCEDIKAGKIQQDIQCIKMKKAQMGQKITL
ncbi:MAG: hypothetical protein KDK45_22635 [Leptospiraceae bacterium]|nr:hypothetical protein [Leptospiraceae bacterium]